MEKYLEPIPIWLSVNSVILNSLISPVNSSLSIVHLKAPVFLPIYWNKSQNYTHNQSMHRQVTKLCSPTWLVFLVYIGWPRIFPSTLSSFLQLTIFLPDRNVSENCVVIVRENVPLCIVYWILILPFLLLFSCRLDVNFLGFFWNSYTTLTLKSFSFRSDAPVGQ